MIGPPRTWIAGVVFAVGTAAGAAGQDPQANYASRQTLADLLFQWEGAAQSSAYSDDLRAQAGREAETIRTRLDAGDFQVGDRIYLVVQEDPLLTDTFSVDVGPLIDLPLIGAVSLAGVLRVEVEAYLTEQVSRFVRAPTLRARALLPVTVTGGVARPGFHTFASSATLADVFRATGLGAQQTVADIEIRRGQTVLWSGERVQRALTTGMTLDQMNMRAGDEVFLPLPQPQNQRGGMQNTMQLISIFTGIPFTVFGIIQTMRRN